LPFSTPLLSLARNIKGKKKGRRGRREEKGGNQGAPRAATSSPWPFLIARVDLRELPT
jgi:hypothetical protein